MIPLAAIKPRPPAYLPPLLDPPITSPPLRLRQIIKQRPGKNKGHQTTKHVARPKIRKWTVEISLRRVLRFERVDEYRDHSGSQEVEDETRQGFQAQGASGDTEEGGCECANIRDGLSVATCMLAESF
jgi:hypothetical protein